MAELRVHAATDAFHAALLADDAEALYERAPCGYLSTTPDGVITKANGTFLTWTGYGLGELVGQRRFVDLLTPGGRIYHETHFATTLRMHGSVREVALEIITADGRRLPALVNSVLDRDELGDPLVIRTAVFDATERRRYEQELLAEKARAELAEARARAVARVLQKTMLPPTLPPIAGLSTTTAFQPAGSGTELGGDFYDVIEVGADDWLAVIGDVSGKGIEAAAVSSLARHTVRAAAVRTSNAPEILHILNEVLLREETDRYLTAIVLRLRRFAGGWACSLSMAGHPLPFRVRSGAVEQIGRPGPVVGLFPGATYHETSERLVPGETLVLYTDGITEARRADGSFLGEDGLAEAISRHAHDPEGLARSLLDEALALGDGLARDDVAVMVLHPLPM